MPNDEPRYGYPKGRNTSELGPVTKKQPYGRHLKRYKLVGKVSYVLGEAVYKTKMLVLHATKGWRTI